MFSGPLLLVLPVSVETDDSHVHGYEVEKVILDIVGNPYIFFAEVEKPPIYTHA